MTPDQILDVSQTTIITLLKVTTPIMVVALVAGLIVALFQALTSIQEMTLTFVPKILLVFLTLILIMPWMADQLSSLTHELYGNIATIGHDTSP